MCVFPPPLLAFFFFLCMFEARCFLALGQAIDIVADLQNTGEPWPVDLYFFIWNLSSLGGRNFKRGLLKRVFSQCFCSVCNGCKTDESSGLANQHEVTHQMRKSPTNIFLIYITTYCRYFLRRRDSVTTKTFKKIPPPLSESLHKMLCYNVSDRAKRKIERLIV